MRPSLRLPSTLLRAVPAACYGSTLALRRWARGRLPRSEGLLGRLGAVEREGFAVAEGFVPAPECDRLRAEVDRLLEEYAADVQRTSNGGDERLFGADRVSAAIGEFASHEVLSGCFAAYCRPRKPQCMTMANRIRATPENLGSGNGWHRDSVGARQFKAILYLSDVDREHGPFQYLRGSHRPTSRVRTALELGTRFDSNRFDTGEFDDYFAGHPDLVTVTASAGTLLLADTTGLHRGAPLTSGTRHALTNYFTDGPPADHVLRLVVNPGGGAA